MSKFWTPVSAVFAVVIGIVLQTFLFAACHHPAPTNPPTFDATDATPAPVEVDAAVPTPAPTPDEEEDAALAYPWCKRACVNMQAKHCPEAERLDGGMTCYAVCAAAEASGKYTLKPQCVAEAGTVEAIRSCKTVRCKR